MIHRERQSLCAMPPWRAEMSDGDSVMVEAAAQRMPATAKKKKTKFSFKRFGIGR